MAKAKSKKRGGKPRSPKVSPAAAAGSPASPKKKPARKATAARPAPCRARKHHPFAKGCTCLWTEAKPVPATLPAALLNAPKMGRPRKFESPEELWDRGTAWIQEQREAKEPLRVTGLAIALGTTRETLMDYEAGKYDVKASEGVPAVDFSYTIKMLKAYVQDYAESKLYGPNAGGPIFALKNFGWTDQTDHRHSGAVTATVVRVYGPEKKPEGHGSAE